MKRSPFIDQIKNFLLSSLSILILFLIWEVLGKINLVNPLYFPAPSVIILKLLYLIFNEPVFLGDIWASCYRLIIGSVISVPPAIILERILAFDQVSLFLDVSYLKSV